MLNVSHIIKLLNKKVIFETTVFFRLKLNISFIRLVDFINILKGSVSTATGRFMTLY